MVKPTPEESKQYEYDWGRYEALRITGKRGIVVPRTSRGLSNDGEADAGWVWPQLSGGGR